MARLFSVICGALPATLLAAGAALMLLGGLDKIAGSPLEGTLGIVWGLAGLLGVLGLWLIIFDVGCSTAGIRRLILSLVAAGVSAAFGVLIAFVPLFSLSDPLSQLLLLWPVAPIVVGVFQMRRVIRVPTDE